MDILSLTTGLGTLLTGGVTLFTAYAAYQDEKDQYGDLDGEGRLMLSVLVLAGVLTTAGGVKLLTVAF